MMLKIVVAAREDLFFSCCTQNWHVDRYGTLVFGDDMPALWAMSRGMEMDKVGFVHWAQ
jgi:hypothetical protein